MADIQKNWAGNLTYSAARYHEPKTVAELQDLVKNASKLKMLGSRHSFNTIADTPEDLISMKHFDQVVSLDREKQQVTIQGGMRYGELAQYLQREGYALHNLASLPHISVVGACMTATHGSGVQNGNLATVVAALEMIDGNGELVRLSREDAAFWGAVVSLGALGIITQITLDIQPTFDVRQDIYLNLPLSALEGRFDEIMSTGYSVSLFNDWQQENFTQVWLKQRMSDDIFAEADFYGATRAEEKVHPLAGMDAINCTEQLGIPGSWEERLPHFRMNFTPSGGEELQTEYFLPRQHAYDGLQALSTLRDQIAPHLFVNEIRAIAADDFWMSPCYQQDCVAFHFTWKQDWPAVQNVLPLIEAKLAPFQPKPHWGKLFTMPADAFQPRYEKLPDFRALVQQYDPQGKFQNAFLETVLG